MELAMPGRAEAQLDPTRTGAGGMRAVRCCGSSSPTGVQIRPGQPSRLEVSTKQRPRLKNRGRTSSLRPRSVPREEDAGLALRRCDLLSRHFACKLAPDTRRRAIPPRECDVEPFMSCDKIGRP